MSDSPNANAKWSKYTIEGNELVRAETCPTCGPGVFLGLQSDRKTCGKGGHTVKNE